MVVNVNQIQNHKIRREIRNSKKSKIISIFDQIIKLSQNVEKVREILVLNMVVVAAVTMVLRERERERERERKKSVGYCEVEEKGKTI
jgi:hypothetical protein